MPSFEEMQQAAKLPVTPAQPAAPATRGMPQPATTVPAVKRGMPPAGGGNNPTSGVRG